MPPPIRGEELRELRNESTGTFVFTTARGAPFTTDSFNWMVKTGGREG